MAWLEVHTPLIRHRKLKKMARQLKITPVQALGHLVSLWGCVLELAEDGDISKWSNDDIAEYSLFEGESRHFVGVLLDTGWLDIRRGGGWEKKLIHDWWDYAGRYLTTKYRNRNDEKLQQIKSLFAQGKPQSKPCAGSVNQSNLSNQSNLLTVERESLTKIIETFLKEKGWGDFLTDKKKVSLYYRQNCKAAKNLLLLAGTEEYALKTLGWCAATFRNKGWNWNLTTVANWFPEYYKKYPPLDKTPQKVKDLAKGIGEESR